MQLNPFAPASRVDWEREAAAALKGKPLESLTFRAEDGVAMATLADRRSDTRALSQGGEWTISARVDDQDPGRANVQALEDLENGASGLVLVFEQSAAARGFGLANNDPSALATALENVALDLIHLRLDGKVHPLANATCLAEMVRQRRLDAAMLRIDFGFDPIGALAGLGALPAAWPQLAQDIAGQERRLHEAGFAGPFFTADSRVWHEAGASTVQELAATFATALAYVRLQIGYGVPFERAFAQVSFTVAVDDDQPMSIAKLRALRLLWANAQTSSGCPARPATIHAETSFGMLAGLDVPVNILRASLAAFSAVVAGADSLTVVPHTSALGLPDAQARRLARNTQMMLLHESHVWRSADPAAGSGALEALTDQMAQRAWAGFQQFEAANGDVPGIVTALIHGRLAAEIELVRRVRMQDIAVQTRRLTGVNSYPDLDERLSSPSNIAMPRMGGLPVQRWSEPFERLRARAFSMGAGPHIFLANIGAIADFASRSAAARSFFEVGGIRAIDSDGFLDSQGRFEVQDMLAAYERSGTRLICICSSDACLNEPWDRDGGTAQTVLQLILLGLRTRGTAPIHIFGREQSLHARGGDLVFVHAGMDAVKALGEALDVATA